MSSCLFGFFFLAVFMVQPLYIYIILMCCSLYCSFHSFCFMVVSLRSVRSCFLTSLTNNSDPAFVFFSHFSIIMVCFTVIHSPLLFTMRDNNNRLQMLMSNLLCLMETHTVGQEREQLIDHFFYSLVIALFLGFLY